MRATDPCRRHGISKATFCAWFSKYGEMEVSEARWPRDFDEKNAKLRRLPAESMTDIPTLKDLLAKKVHDARFAARYLRLGDQGEELRAAAASRLTGMDPKT